MTQGFNALVLTALDQAPATPSVAANDHFVEFYDDDAALVESVRTFVSIGLSEGDAAVVVAGPAHRAAFDRVLGRSVDLTAARAKSLYTVLDAEETMSLFMRGGLPDPQLFETVIGLTIERAAAAGKNVRLFGEMVAILWAEGNVRGALELEELWNRLAQKHPFKLFCAYPAELFGSGQPESISAVCHQHSQVVVPQQAD